MKESKVIEFILVGLVSFLVGIGVGVGGSALTKEKPPDVVATAQQEVIKELTSLDLTIPICEPDYIKENGNLLCRELTCLQFSRGIDSQTSGASCESIGNVANKKAIIEHCSKFEEQQERTNCIEVYWRRN